MTKQDAEKLFASARNFNKGKPVALNTRLVKHYYKPEMPQVLSLVLHETPVVMFLEAALRLNTAGWRTRTTKDRMNSVVKSYGYAVVQIKGDWFVLNKRDNSLTPYHDGIELVY